MEDIRYLDNGVGGIKIIHNYGFFSSCSVRLHSIIHYFNNNKKVPSDIDTSDDFFWYKKWKGNLFINDDVTYDFFKKYDDVKISLYYSKPVNFDLKTQYIDYKTIDYTQITPFMKKYFEPSDDVLGYIDDIETKYGLYDYSNICVLYYRGNDKVNETNLGDYESYINNANMILSKNPNTMFLVQSDEMEFIELMKKTYQKKVIIFNDEIRYVKRSNIISVDKINPRINNNFAKLYLAITIIMSKCKNIICNTGNCSLWIMLYRANANNVYQLAIDKMIE